MKEFWNRFKEIFISMLIIIAVFIFTGIAIYGIIWFIGKMAAYGIVTFIIGIIILVIIASLFVAIM